MATYRIKLEAYATVEAPDIDTAWERAQELNNLLWVDSAEGELDALPFSVSCDITLSVAAVEETQ